MTSLSDRVKEAIDTSGKSVKDIARACEVTEQAVYDWRKGSTKSIDGDNLVELADITGFEAKWIAKGKGPKRRIYASSDEQMHVLQVMQRLPHYATTVVRIVDAVTSGESDTGDGERNAA